MYNIVLLGRPNVGKSSIFNFLCSKKEAKVDDQEGTTLDWRSKEIENICIWDSPGIWDFSVLEKFPIVPDEIYLVIENIVLDHDKRLYRHIKNLFDKVLVIINKVDLGQDVDYSYFENFIEISLRCGFNLKTLKLMFTSNFISYPLNKNRKIWGFIGKPNVGKSSLINSLIDAKRQRVEDFEGTTREFLPVYAAKNIFLDTPGDRRNVCIPNQNEIFGIIVVISTLIEKQDLRFLNVALKNKKPVILFVNKTDLVKNKKEISMVCHRINQLFDIPIVIGSCLRKSGIKNLFQFISKIERNYYKRIPTSKLNEWLAFEIRKKEPKLKFISQVGVGYPKFFVDCKLTTDKQRMIKRKISNDFDFKGIPIEIICKLT